MVVQHNMQAMNASRMLGITTEAQGKSTEKLSSGFRINRAADDAAGLSISEKMRKQIRGLDQASTNASDGVSAVQTAEGALTEVHAMLQRMNELAVQAANGTNSETDRQSIQDEVDQLTTEIDRVAETTKFNETYLLKGDPDGTSKTVYFDFKDAGLDGKYLGVTETANNASVTIKATMMTAGSNVTIGGKEYTILSSDAGDTTKDYYTAAADVDGGVSKNDSRLITNTKAVSLMLTELAAANSVGSATAITAPTYTATNANVDANPSAFTITKGSNTTTQALAFNLHVGADADMTNKIGVDIETMDTKYLGINKLNVKDDTGIAATYAIDAISGAVAKVSAQRSSLGAIQNRLEHSIANLDNVVENSTAAESRIRDTDMADEMVRYSKNNILAQAGQSMLAQANQATQGVLSLLQ
ncbi:MAG: flagellar hook protein [Pseudobutyrivibrio sp.]|nr:flagellar hook protein [Pseudobutyrivibrio sp.]